MSIFFLNITHVYHSLYLRVPMLSENKHKTIVITYFFLFLGYLIHDSIPREFKTCFKIKFVINYYQCYAFKNPCF